MPEKDLDVRNLLKSGQRLAAMNLYAARHGGKLEEIRANVEELEFDDGITGYYPNAYRWENIVDGTFRDAVASQLRQGKLITAIRLCREQYPCPLKYAKQAALAWRSILNLELPPLEKAMEEQAEYFDIRWHSKLQPEKRFLFRKQDDSFIEFRFELQIAGRSISDQFNGVVDWTGLAASKLSDGEYIIFICSCGDMACGGFSRVEVIHVEGRTLWYDQGKWNIFEEAVYKAAISRVETALVELAHNHPGIPIKSC